MTRRYAYLALLLGTILSTRPAFAEDAADGAAGSEEIVVTGERSHNAAMAGTKSALPIVETPQSISVVTADDFADLGLANLGQALRFVAGVTPEQRGSSAEVYDLFKLRGFDAAVYLDGLKQFASPSGYLSPQVDVSRLDRVEILKGPASVLYGQSSPGGLVAQSSKLPLARDGLYGGIAGTYGTYDLYRVDADIGGNAGSDLLWRLYGSANGAHTEQRFGKRERQTISGAVTWGASGSTSLTLLANYSHDPYNGDYGVFPTVGTLIRNPNGQLPTDFDGGEAGNRFRRNQGAITYIARHDFGNGWALRASGRYQNIKSQLGLMYVSGAPSASDPTLHVYDRASYATRETLNSWTFDNQLTGTVETGPLKHNLLFGVDRQVAHSTEDYAFGSAPPLNVYAPVYGTVTVPQTPAQVPDAFGGYIATHQRQQGIYAQDQIAWGDLRLLLGGRQDWARVVQAGGSPEKSQKFTWRTGLTYVSHIGIAPYISYSTSFEPQSGLVQTGNGGTANAKPSQGKQLEVGAKYTIPGTQLLLTAAWFRINQTNLLTAIPNSNFSNQTGEVRSQGVEVEGTMPLPYGFNARFAFSRQSVKVVKDADPTRIGARLETVGRGGVSANLEWSPKSGPLYGLTLGGAVRHVDDVYAGVSAYDGIARNSPSYTLFDALARFDLAAFDPRLKGLSLAINAQNIFDKKYLTSCYSNYNWCWYGNRRTVQGTIAYRF